MHAAVRFFRRQVRARPLACFSVAFLLGLLLRQRVAVATLGCALALLASVGCGIGLRRRRQILTVVILLAGLLAGMTRMGLAMDAIRPIETRYSVRMEGRVASEPFTHPDTGRRIFRFDLDSADSEPCNLSLRLYLRGEEALLGQIEYGQRLSLTGHIWAPDPVTNPGQFDFGAYLNRQGMDAYGTAKIEDVTLLGETRDLQSVVVSARQVISGRIDALFPRSAAMMRALVLGDRSLLGDEQRQAMSRSGTAHLISISGLHVTVLSALLAFLLRRFMSRRKANLIAVALLIPYGALIGFTAPFVRALVLFAVICAAPVAGLPSDPITRLCVAMLGWLLVKPLSVGDAGFVLSYSASAGIHLLMPPLMRLTGVDGLRRRKPASSLMNRALRRLAVAVPSMLCASLAAQLATLPAVIAFFGVQSIVSVPFNLICVPLCMAGYILGLLALLVSAIWLPLGAALALVPDLLLAWLVIITQVSEAIPLASVRIGRYPFALVLAHWAILVAASDLSRIRFRLRRLLPLGLVGIAALSSLLIFLGAWNYSIVFLDADQADCAVVRSRGHTFVIDTGDTYTPVADYLNATCLHLDGVVLSHPHQDHAGGLSDILESFRPDAIYVPKGWFEVEEVSPAVAEGIDAARAMGIEIVELSAGDAVAISDACRMDIYSPDGGGLPTEVNDLSLLALVSCEGQKALFTGDLSVRGEPEFIPDTDVLKVAHHGSDKATSERFLAAATPEIAVISVGENNYGHPGEETLRKLADIGAQIYETKDCGAITLSWRGGQWHIKTYREVPHEVE